MIKNSFSKAEAVFNLNPAHNPPNTPSQKREGGRNT